MMRRDEQRGAETLDLQRPRRLAHNALPDAARCDRDEREQDRGDCACEHTQARERLPPAARPPHVRERQRDEHAGPDLRRDPDTE